MNIKPERTRERFLMLVVLVLVSIAGVAALFYKLDHPTPIRVLQSF
jgi:hypothetical protein